MKFFFSGVLFIICVPLSVNAQSVDTFINSAFKHSPVIAAQQRKSRASKEDYNKESILKTNPVFSLNYSNVPINEWPALDTHPMSGISLGISQFFASPYESHNRKSFFFQKHLTEKEKLNEIRNNIALQVRIAYHNLVFLNTQKRILNENRITLKNILKLSQSLVAVNRMNSTQLLTLQGSLYSLNANLTDIEGKIEQQQQIMESICGTTLQWPLKKVTIDNWISQETKFVVRKFKVSHHPLYKKTKALYKTSIEKHDLEKAKVIPGATLGFEYRFRQEIPGGDQGDDFVSLKASMPLPLYYPIKERHAIKAANENKKAMKEELRAMRIMLEKQWTGERSRHEKLSTVINDYHKIIKPMYLAAYESQIKSLASGTLRLIDVLDSYRQYLDSSMKEAMFYRDLMVSRSRLNYLLYNVPEKTAESKEAK